MSRHVQIACGARANQDKYTRARATHTQGNDSAQTPLPESITQRTLGWFGCFSWLTALPVRRGAQVSFLSEAQNRSKCIFLASSKVNTNVQKTPKCSLMFDETWWILVPSEQAKIGAIILPGSNLTQTSVLIQHTHSLAVETRPLWRTWAKHVSDIGRVSAQ